MDPQKSFKTSHGLTHKSQKTRNKTESITSDPTQVLVRPTVHRYLTISWRQLEVVTLGNTVLVVGQIHQKPWECVASQETSFNRARDTCEVVKKD